MRRQEKLTHAAMRGLDDLEKGMNLSLCWTDEEHGINDNGFWSVSRASVLSGKSQRLVGSIYVRNQEFSIHDEGLTELERLAVERHLKGLKMTMRKA